MAVNKFKFNHLCLSIMLVTGSVATVAEAAVTADKHTINNINVLTNSNNSETVNINAPSASGISYNRYTKFNVNDKGLVLNNSKDPSLTSVAGLIAGNRNLNASAPARVILNEVTSSQASKLEGNLEVAGQKAHVIIANPNGITCNGCDFINTSRNTLTTGTPQFTQNGELAGFKVEKGSIVVNDAGMKDKFSEYTDLISRYVVLNGTVEAQNLTVMAGRNNLVGLTDTGATAQSKLDDATTDVLVDVSRLGGMYANKITMVANNNGVGVRNAGAIRAFSDLDISSSGDIINNLGLMQTARSITLNSDNKVTNQGGTIDTLLLNVKAKELANNKQTVFGLNQQGQFVSLDTGIISGNITSLEVEKKITNSAKLLGVQLLNISASELENNNGFIARTGALNIKAGSVKNSSSLEFNINNYTENKGIHSHGNININADKIVNEGQIYAFKDVDIIAKDLDNKFSHIKAENDIDLKVDNMLYMADAVVKAGRDVNLDVGKVDNNYTYNTWWAWWSSPVTETKQGEITAGRNVDYRVQKSLGNHNVIKANNAVTITAEGNFDNKKAITGNTISLKSQDFENYGELNAADQLSVEVTHSLSNSGVLKGANNIVLSAPVVTNSGTIEQGNIKINADKVVNEGQIYAFNNVDIIAKDLDNKFSHIKADNDVNLKVDNMLYMADAVVKAGRDVNLDVGKVDNNYTYNAWWAWWSFPVTETKQGEITAGRNVDYRVQKSLGNHNVIKANNAVTITAEGNFDNKKAITGNTISLKSQDFENYGELNAADQLSVEVTHSLSNSGVLKGANNIVLSAPVVTNSGTIESADSLIYSPSFKNSGQLIGDVKFVDTLKPNEEAQNPTEEAQNPTEEAQNPTEEAQNPAEEAQNPAEEAQNPTGNDDVDPQVVNSTK